jgi:hypothetical protein
LSFFLYCNSFLFPFEGRPVFPKTTQPNIPRHLSNVFSPPEIRDISP